MADFNSSLPVRTQTNGDVAVKVVDGTTPSQALAIDSSGKVTVKLDDAAGVGITSTAISTKQALDVNIANTISSLIGVADESTFTYGSSLQQPFGGVYSTAITPLTSGQSGAISLTANRDVRVNLRSSAGVELGNSAATKLFVQSTDGTNSQSFTAAGEAKVDLTTALFFGSVTGGTAGTQSGLSGGVYNTAALTLTTGQQAALQLTVAGALKVDATATVQPVSGTITANQGTAGASPWAQNLTQISGASPSATNALPTQLSTAGAFVSASNPLPVIIDPMGAGTPKNLYTDSAAVAVGATATQSSTAAGTLGLYVQQVLVSASGKFKAIVQIETGVATGVFNIIFAAFNSTASPTFKISLPNNTLVATGARIQVLMTNNDLAAQDLYSTISGFQI